MGQENEDPLIPVFGPEFFTVFNEVLNLTFYQFLHFLLEYIVAK